MSDYAQWPRCSSCGLFYGEYPVGKRIHNGLDMPEGWRPSPQLCHDCFRKAGARFHPIWRTIVRDVPTPSQKGSVSHG